MLLCWAPRGLLGRVMLNIGYLKARSVSKVTLRRYAAWEARVASFAAARSMPLTSVR